MNSFTTNENKALLWKLMVESKSFSGLPEDNYELVKSIFEKEITIQSTIQSGKSLTDMNKLLLLEVTRKLNPLRTSEELSVEPNSHVTAADISKQRQTQFSNSLHVKQIDFNNLMKSNKPATIDFRDVDHDSPIGADMGNILSNTIASREEQFNMAVSSHNADTATKWIETGGIKPTSKPSTVKIGEKIDNTNIKGRHTVTFTESSVNLLEFLNAYETPPLDTTKIITEMKHIYKEMSASLAKLNNMIKLVEEQDRR
jgi:hypothetical protein